MFTVIHKNRFSFQDKQSLIFGKKMLTLILFASLSWNENNSIVL